MRQFIFLSTIILFFSSCSDNSGSTINVFKASEEGLQQSIKTISHSNEVIYRSLEERLADPGSKEYAIKWQPRASHVKYLSDNIVKYIEDLKSYLKNEAGPNKSDDKESFNENNLTVTNHVFESHNKGKELFEKLIKYRQEILSIDPELNQVFSPTLALFAKGFDYTKNDSKTFTRTFFNNTPAIAAMVMLSKFENNVKIIENNFVIFCLNKTSSVFFDGEGAFIQPLVSQSSSYVKAGDKIEVNAGIGYLSTTLQPRITINQKLIQLNENGVAVYKFKTPLKAGKYYMPVKIEYTKPDGTRELMTKNIEYTVIEPNQNPH